MQRHLSDWLEYYLDFTQKSEPPIQYHVWSGISAIASCLRRKCYCNWGLRGRVYPNFYISLVGPPGGRKGTAMKIAKSMLQQLEIPLGSDALGSIQMLYKEIKNSQAEYISAGEGNKTIQHKSLSIWSEEFQVFLSDQDPRFIGSLTDLFDCADNWKYSTLSRGLDDLSNCWLNIIGAITPSLLQSKLNMDAVGGGLLSRIIFIVGYGASKRVALPFLTQEEEKLQQTLQEDLEQICNLAGSFKLSSDFLSAWVPWYEHSNIESSISNDKFLGYNSRRALHLNKLCMVFSASENNDMIITAKHFQKSLAILEEAEEEMPNAFYGLGRGQHSEIYTSVLRYIEGVDNFSLPQITKVFQLDAMPTDIQQYINMAETTGKIKKIKTPSNNIQYETIHDVKPKVDKHFLNKTLYKRMV
jgi:hypothetical protein